MRKHLPALGFAAAAILTAAVWVLGWSQVAADRTQAGEEMVAIFLPSYKPWQVLAAFEGAPVRQFKPLGYGNAWIVEASDAGLAQALKENGAVAVLQAQGVLHFALGCATSPPLSAPFVASAKPKH